MKKSVQTRLTMWFALSVVGVALVYAAITIVSLRHELRIEQWERAHPDQPDYILHGTYSEAEINDIAGYVLRSSLLLSLPVALAALFIGRYLARNSLRPVAAINDQLQAIDAENLSSRIHAPDADRELEMITGNINGLLTRLEKSYRDMSEFSARVAHELRTPLTLMRLQLEESAAEVEPNLAESLQEELSRLENYVEQCLLIARAERGQLEIQRERVDLEALLADVLEPFALLAREESRAIELSTKRVGTVSAAPWVLRQVFHNLLANALRHGEGSVRVSLSPDQEGASIVIVNEVRKVKVRGMGLGLRIIEALERVDGGFSMTSESTAGVFTATVRWPVADESTLETTPAALETVMPREMP